ncbi:MAG: bifunctional 4-hydroxy-2-oxoglutarate aldolase/2-dehydro-3-deoxy-phosphogluconate aldolase [Acidimicrobiales bacterium]
MPTQREIETADPVMGALMRLGVVPLVVLDDPGDAARVAGALLEGGLPCAEVAFRTAAAPAVLARMRSCSPELLLGAGTVLSPEQVDEAVDAGAAFVVSPGTDAAVVRRCQTIGVPILPGVATASEIQSARCLGAEVLKFFPSEALGGLRMLTALADPFPNVWFVPTGGIGPELLEAYLSHRAVAAVGGSWIVKRQLVAAGHFSEISRLAAAAAAAVARVRGAPS